MPWQPLGVNMGINWDGMRASAGAAALAIALVAGAPAQATMYKVTVTEQEADGTTNVGSAMLDSANNYIFNSPSYFSVSYAILNTSGFLNTVFSGSTTDGAFFIDNQFGGMAGIFSGSYKTENGISYYQDANANGKANYLNLFTNAAIDSGLYNEFNIGEYALGDSFGGTSQSQFNTSDYSYSGTYTAFRA